MENNAKKKVMIKIAGTQLTLVTDEADGFVDTVEQTVNNRMSSLTRNSYRANRTDAALLCAVDFCSEKLKAEKKVMNLEAQISLYDVNLRRLREEIIVLKQQAGVPLDETDLALARELAEERGETFAAPSDGAEDKGEAKIRTLEKYLEERRKGEEEGQSREDKLRRIESLLRGGDADTDGE